MRPDARNSLNRRAFLQQPAVPYLASSAPSSVPSKLSAPCPLTWLRLREEHPPPTDQEEETEMANGASQAEAQKIVKQTNANELVWELINATSAGEPCAPLYRARAKGGEYYLRFMRRPIVGGIGSTLDILDSTGNFVTKIRFSGKDRDTINTAVMKQIAFIKQIQRQEAIGL